jgi:hypothetical protein
MSRTSKLDAFDVEVLRDSRYKESTAGCEFDAKEERQLQKTLHKWLSEKRAAPATADKFKADAKRVPVLSNEDPSNNDGVTLCFIFCMSV